MNENLLSNQPTIGRTKPTIGRAKNRSAEAALPRWLLILTLTVVLFSNLLFPLWGLGGLTFAQSFITEWKPTSNTLTIPTTGSGYNYRLRYRELPSGTFATLNGQTGDAVLTGLTIGATYEIFISGNFPRIYFLASGQANRNAIINIKQWGSIVWSSMEGAFSNCSNLKSNATDVPNLSNVTNMNGMFTKCSVFNAGNITNWNTGNVTDMGYLFWEATAFNQPIGSWNTGNVTNMGYLFWEATAFNQPIGTWNTGSVTNMEGIFYRATAFNQPIRTWNTSSVTNMREMFSGIAFNQPLDSWNTSNVTNMRNMFGAATAFN